MSKDTKVNYVVDEAGKPVRNSTGYKTRRAEEVAATPAPRPRKMSLLKPKRKVSKKDNRSNPSLLVFPTDRLGITSAFKKELIKAASRVGSDKKNLKLIKDTVEILMGHLDARFEQNTALPRLKARVDTSAPAVVETPTETPEATQGASMDDTAVLPEVEYAVMVNALKDAGVTPSSRKKEDVELAYLYLTQGGE